MEMLITLLCILSLAIAEPPVGDSYTSDFNHDHSHSFQRSPSQEYGLPASNSGASRNALTTEYGPPNVRTDSAKAGLYQDDRSSKRSGLSQEYGLPNVRSSSSYSPASRGLSTEYGVASERSAPSNAYSVPAARNGPAHGGQFLMADDTRTPANQYGTPEFRTPSEEYGVPAQRNFGLTPSQKYGLPSSRNLEASLSQDYGAPSARSDKFQQSYTTPQSTAKSFVSSNRRSSKGSTQFRSQSLSTSYGVPKNSDSYFQKSSALSQTYTAPNQQDLSDTYEIPTTNTRDLSQEYGVPSGYETSQKNTDIALQPAHTSFRSVPSDTYGVPRDFVPSEEYGVPDQYSNLSDQGYSYARVSLDDLNQEPANYNFNYKVNDYKSGSDFGHAETRLDNKAEGIYYVVLPDGNKQVVEYEADERGFKPRISVEPADLGRSGGYDDNASDLARSGDGPY